VIQLGPTGEHHRRRRFAAREESRTSLNVSIPELLSTDLDRVNQDRRWKTRHRYRDRDRYRDRITDYSGHRQRKNRPLPGAGVLMLTGRAWPRPYGTDIGNHTVGPGAFPDHLRCPAVHVHPGVMDHTVHIGVPDCRQIRGDSIDSLLKIEALFSRRLRRFRRWRRTPRFSRRSKTHHRDRVRYRSRSFYRLRILFRPGHPLPAHVGKSESDEQMFITRSS